MNVLRLSLAAAAVALACAAQAQTAPPRIEQRFSTFAGSSANSTSLVTGLRKGGAIKLTGAGETTTFTSPTKPMGYGNVTRALDLAQRELAAGGITDPTPKELQAALMGGTVSGPNGEFTYQGVLQMRADGMGWGQIAHEIGVHPGLGRPVTTASVPPTSSGGRSSGIVTAAGGSAFSPGNGQGRALGANNRPSAPGASATSAAGSAAGAGTGIVRGGGNGNAFGHAR